MSEQPNEARHPKPLELHHKAMLAVTDWMAAFEGASGRGPVVSDMDAIENLVQQLKAALEEDEQIRADLLAAHAKLLVIWEQTKNILRFRCDRDKAIIHMDHAIAQAEEIRR